MSVRLVLPGPLWELADGQGTVELGGKPTTVGEALGALEEMHVGVYDRLMTEQGELRPHVNVFVGTENIRHTGGLETPVTEGAELFILPAVSGG